MGFVAKDAKADKFIEAGVFSPVAAVVAVVRVKLTVAVADLAAEIGATADFLSDGLPVRRQQELVVGESLDGVGDPALVTPAQCGG